MTATVEPTTLIADEGLYPDVPEDAYHRDPVVGGSLSSTGARTLADKTPAHFDYERRHGRPDTTQFDIGRAAHTTLLGRGGEIAVIDADSYVTKAARAERDDARAAGLTPLLTEQWEQVQAMVASVRQHPRAGALFTRADGQPEVTVVARDPETGVMCRVRVDWLCPNVVVDFKTGQDSSPAGMAKAMSNYGYNQQGEFYVSTHALAAGLDAPLPFVLVHVEKNPPYLVGIGEPDEQALAWGRAKNRRARGIYRACSRTGMWPGHPLDPVPLSLPGWQLHQLEDAEAQGHFDVPTA